MMRSSVPWSSSTFLSPLDIPAENVSLSLDCQVERQPATWDIVRRPVMLKRLALTSINSSDTLFRLVERAAFRRFKPGIDQGAACGGLQLHLGCGPRVLDGW